MNHVGVGSDEVEALARTEYERLVRAVTMACGSLTLAEDAVQEAFARAWRRADEGGTFSHLAGWVVTVALNQTRRVHRGDSSVPGGPSERHSPNSDRTEAIALRTAVAALPTRQREVIVMHYFLDWSISMIAASLDVSEGNVKNALFRGRRSLAAQLSLDEGAPR
jgi:RNA polymerase sigma factor (sigma-70 family)